MSLNLEPNLIDADGFYANLVAVHEGMTSEQSAALNARLILILANHIGEVDVLDEALGVAARSMRRKSVQ